MKRQASKLQYMTGASEEDRIRTFFTQIFGRGEIDSSLLEGKNQQHSFLGGDSSIAKHHSVKKILSHFISTYKKELIYDINSTDPKAPLVNYSSYTLRPHSLPHVETAAHTKKDGKTMDFYFKEKAYGTFFEKPWL